jgi:DnaK suppressor protein
MTWLFDQTGFEPEATGQMSDVDTLLRVDYLLVKLGHRGINRQEAIMLVGSDTATPAQSTPTAASSPADRTGRFESINTALLNRRADLVRERASLLSNMEINGSVDAGDDAADLGTKAFVREQELVIAKGIQARIEQVDRALERLSAGRYGRCERCSQEIPVARLAAFPSATQCVRCKSLEERR